MEEDIEITIRHAIVIHRVLMSILFIIVVWNIVLGHNERKELQNELIINRQVIREMGRQQIDAYSREILRQQEQTISEHSEVKVPLAPSPTPKVIVKTVTKHRRPPTPTPRPWWNYFSK